MNRKNPRVIVGLTAIALIVTAGLVVAGPLDPPAGPIAPTYKTLTEVEPRIAINATNTPGDADSLFKITQPGSYYLTGNITGVPGKHGIEIDTPDPVGMGQGVTLDLNGFQIMGTGSGSHSGIIRVTGDQWDKTTILNGSVRYWGGSGIDVAFGGMAHVSGVQANNNAGYGIRVGFASSVSDCSTDGSGGISTGQSCRVTNCHVSNAQVAISVDDGSVVTNCTTFINFNSTAILCGDSCVVSNCASGSIESVGAGGGSIVAGANATVTGCTVDYAPSGIIVGARSSVSGCVTTRNYGDGITVGDFSTISGCTSDLNSGNGIVAGRSCHVRQNTCSGNGTGSATGSGIRLTGLLNRVEDNVCNENDIGISAADIRNVIVRNTCGSNVLNWSVVAGNHLFVLNAAASGAISGSSGGVSLSSDPNANFSH